MFIDGKGGRLYHLSHVRIFSCFFFFTLTKIDNITHVKPFMYNVVTRPNILQKSCGVHTARFLKYVWSFYNIMHERVKNDIDML